MNKPASLAASESFKARFTTAEFLRMAETGAFDDMRVELVDGELERLDPPHNRHAGRQASIVIRLAQILPASLLRGEVGIDAGYDTVMGCDVAVLRRPVADDRLLQAGEIALVVEVAETTAMRDRGMKRLAYARAGVPTYWVVDGQLGVTYIYTEPTNGDYAQVSTVRFGEPLTIPGADGAITIE